MDSKRGDIGSTAEKYAQEAFERYRVDAVTVNPYLGYDSVKPFVEYAEKGVIILCRTSNATAADIQDIDIGGEKLYQRVASLVQNEWNYNANCLLVVGATWPSQMASIRNSLGNMPFLVPGVGSQGGDIKSMVEAGKTADGLGLIISSSRAVLYASAGEDFASAAREVVLNLREEINRYR